MGDSDGINVTLRSYANVIVPPCVRIDMSHLTDEEFAAAEAECSYDCMCGACTCSMCGSKAYDCDGQCTMQYEDLPDAQQVSATPSSGPPPR